MLVTQRRKGEALLIGDDIEITIVHIGRSRVRVGIRAPKWRQVTPGEKLPAWQNPEFSGPAEILENSSTIR
jgi:hypothetical protein